jgi:hypothetical protein
MYLNAIRLYIKSYLPSYFVDLRTKEATTIAPTAAILPTIANPMTPSAIRVASVSH